MDLWDQCTVPVGGMEQIGWTPICRIFDWALQSWGQTFGSYSFARYLEGINEAEEQDRVFSAVSLLCSCAAVMHKTVN